MDISSEQLAWLSWCELSEYQLGLFKEGSVNLQNILLNIFKEKID